MKKKKLTLQFDKKIISNLTKIQGGDVIVGGTLSNAPDDQSICLCGSTTNPNYTNITCNCPLESVWPNFICPMDQSLRGGC